MRMRGEMEVFGGGRILETRPDAGGMTTPCCFGFVTDYRHHPNYVLLLVTFR